MVVVAVVAVVVVVVAVVVVAVVVVVGFNIHCNLFAPSSQSTLLFQYNYNEAWWYI